MRENQKMFKERVVTVSVTRTINLGNYESIKVMGGFSGKIEDNQTVEDAYIEAFDVATEEILRYLRDIGVERGV